MKLMNLLLAVLCIAVTSQAVAASPTTSTQYAYNAQGQITRMDGADGGTFSYDGKGNLTSWTLPSGEVFKYLNYTTAGLPSSIVSGPAAWDLTYSADGEVTQLLSRSNPVVISTMAYNASGDLTRLSHPDGSALEYVYDDARRLKSLINGLGEKVHFTRDAAGNLVTTTYTRTNGSVTAVDRARYDEKNRLIAEEQSSNKFQKFEYDLVGNLKKHTDALNQVTHHEVDAFGRKIRSTDPAGGSIETRYDAQGNVASITDARGLKTRYLYDHLNRVTQIDSNDAGRQQLAYDAHGNLVRLTNAKGEQVDMTYDTQGRLLHKRYPSMPSQDVQYVYRPDQIQTDVITVDTTESYYSYDKQRLLIQSSSFIDPSGKRTTVGNQFHYDRAGRSTGWSGPSGKVMYTRDQAGQIASIDYAFNSKTYSVAKQVKHLPFGPVSEIVWGNDSVSNRYYDQKYRLTGMSAGKTGGSFSYDATGKLTNRKLPGSSQSYTYDARGQLLTETDGTTRTAYTYDAAGNRTQARKTNAQTGALLNQQTLAYASDSNRVIGKDGVALRSDANGNLVDVNNGRVYIYSAENRLQEVLDKQNRKIASYRYNAAGQRKVAYTYSAPSTTPSYATHYSYNQNGQLIARQEYDSAGKLNRAATWIWIDQLPVAQVLLEGFNLATPRVSVFYLHADPLNTPRIATDRLSNMAWLWASDGYGNTPPLELPSADSPAPSLIALRFPGQYDEVESALYYNYFRDYNPDIGRYMQSDPIGLAGGMNVFTYAGNNPTSFVDLLGLAMSGQGTSNAGPGGFPQGGLDNRAGPAPKTVAQKLVDFVVKTGVKKLASTAAESLVDGGGKLVNSPPVAGVLMFLHAQKLGGCDASGNCSDSREPPYQCRP